MSGDKIENHLFEKYCVEGEDKELCKLIEERDKEIRAKAIDTFLIAIETHMKVVGNTYLEDIREIAEKLKEV